MPPNQTPVRYQIRTIDAEGTERIEIVERRVQIGELLAEDISSPPRRVIRSDEGISLSYAERLAHWNLTEPNEVTSIMAGNLINGYPYIEKKEEKYKGEQECHRCNDKGKVFAKIEGLAHCKVCTKDGYTNCDVCHKYVSKGTEIIDYNDVVLCFDCYQDHAFPCIECQDVYPISSRDNDQNICNRCRNQYTERDQRVNRLYRSEEKGVIITSTRPFGVEIETQYHNDIKAQEVKDNLPAGIQWGSDGSIRGHGVELRTPILSGKSGEDVITALCSLIKPKSFTVDSSCGYHLHIDVLDAKNDKLRHFKNVWLFYMAFEDVLLSFLPKSRRNNNYCLPLRTDYHYKEIKDAQIIEDLEKIWYRVPEKKDLKNEKNERKHHSRRRGINLHTMFAFNHIEIRFHSGTINARKILEWANLHLTIIDGIFKGDIDVGRLNYMNNQTDITDKTENFFAMVGLPKSSRAYFIARQELFEERRILPRDEMVEKEAKSILSSEREA